MAVVPEEQIHLLDTVVVDDVLGMKRDTGNQAEDFTDTRLEGRPPLRRRHLGREMTGDQAGGDRHHQLCAARAHARARDSVN